MQALIISNTEPYELEQLTISKSFSFLPFGNEIALTYLIKCFLESGVSDIHIAHTSDQHSHFVDYVEKHRSLWPCYLKINLFLLPKYTSLPESLYRMKDLLVSDYLFIIYSTSIFFNIDLRKLFLTMIRKKSSMVVTFSSLPISESKVFKLYPKDLTVTSGTNDDLVAYFGSYDIKKQTKLPRNLLVFHKNVLFRSDLRDCGFYLLSRFAVDCIASQR